MDTRIKQIDGLRGSAVLLVVCFHLFNNNYASTAVSQLNSMEVFLMYATSFGWCGVNLFFVLSGFLIVSKLLSQKDRPNFFRNFFIRRFFRIVPLYYVFLVLFLIIRFFINDNSLQMFDGNIPIYTYFLFIQNLYMSVLGHFGPNVLTPSWSLAVEEQFYLIIPFLVYWLKSKQVVFVSIVFVFYALFNRFTASNWFEEYTHFLSRVDALFLGVLYAFGRFYKINYYYYLKNYLFRVFSFLLIFILYFNYYFFNHLLISYFFLIILDIVLDLKADNKLANIFLNPVLIWVGKKSYFIYLFHQLIVGLCFFLFQYGSNPNLASFNSYIIVVFGICVTLVFSMMSEKYFESKMISLGHILTK